MSDKYLVTGGAGFIGSSIVKELVKQEKDVVVLDNLSTGKIKNLETVLSSIEFIEGDIRNTKDVEKATAKVDFVLHQAAITSVPASLKNPRKANAVNINGTLNLLESASQKNVKRFILASSCAVYGDPDSLPCTENMEAKPETPYALTKLTGEKYCRIYSRQFGLSTLSLRYFNVYGPGQGTDSSYTAVIPSFIEAILEDTPPSIFGNGSQTRDFVFIKDVAKAVIKSCHIPGDLDGNVLNIGTGEQTSINSLWSNLAEVANSNLEPEYKSTREGDISASLADVSGAQSILEYKPETDLKEGLKQTYEWYKFRYGEN